MLAKQTMILTIAGMLVMAGSAMADEKPVNGAHTEHGSGHGEAVVPKPEAASTAASPSVTSAGSPVPHDMGHEEDSHNMEHNEDGHGSHSHTEPAATADPAHEPSSVGVHSHGNEGDLVETPANVPVLSSFAALNGAFLLFGAWSKFGRKPKKMEGQQLE